MSLVLAECSASISELNQKPSALITAAEGSPAIILNHNTPMAYLVPAETYEWLMDMLSDFKLNQIAI